MRLKVLCLYALIVLAVSCVVSPALGQSDAINPLPENPPPQAVDTAPDAHPEAAGVRFSFRGATFQQVIEFFSRSTGLPVVWESPPPEGTLDYLAPEAYELDEALRVLNIILQSKGVMLRVDESMLYLQQLTEMQREDIPTFVGELPVEVTDDQIVTVVRPLNVALAKPLAEQLASLVGAYGSITALDEQNSLVITETAAQVRRLVRIVEALDREDPDDAMRIFPVQYADAEQLMAPLTALMSRTVERVVLNQKNQPQRVKTEEMSGLSISFDKRTNTIVAKGVQNRLDKLAEVIAMLDVPESGQGRVVRTFTLSRLSPQQAVGSLSQAYQNIPAEQRPTLLASDDLGKLTIIGSAALVGEASDLLRELDGTATATDAAPRTEPASIIEVITLQRAEPSALMAAVRGLLTPRQQAMVRILPGPDGSSLVVSGPAADVQVVQVIVPVLDLARPVDRQVRLMRLTSLDGRPLVERTTELYRRQVEAADRADDPTLQLEVEYENASRTLTLIGSAQAIDQFSTALRTIEEHRAVERETRQVEVANARPSALVAPLQALSHQLLQPRDGTTYESPVFEPVDQLELLILTALPEQFAVIESLIETLDKPDPADRQFRVITLTGVEQVDALLFRTNEAYGRLTAGYESDEMPPPEVTLDTLTGSLVVTGRVRAVQLYEQALGEARRLLPPSRSGRMITLRQAKASDVVVPLLELLTKTAPAEPVRQVPDPTIEVIEHTNSLYVVAESAQHQVIERYVRELDTFEPTDLPPLKLIQVRAADAGEIASMLLQRYDRRPAEQRREQPVEITADAATNTLIITAHEDVFEEVKSFVDSINRASEEGPERETMIFPLKIARAADVSQALNTLYPDPPIPLDRRGRAMPHLRPPKEVYVSADPATNTLIIEAPSDRRSSFEALVEQLDRVELPPTAELRTYHIERGDPAQIARTLNDLARQGVMSEQPEDGSKPADVLIQAEPLSRTLIVAGDAVTFEKTEQILDDLQVVPIQRALRVFEVHGTDPQEIADRAQRLYEEQTADIPGAQAVSVEVDRSTGTLMVIAEDEAMMRFTALFNELQDTIAPPPDVRLVALEFGDAGEVVEFLRDLIDSSEMMLGSRLGSPPVVEAIERTNSIMIAAQREHHDIIAALISELDRMEPKAMPPLRILQLRTADAVNLATALTRQYSQRPVEERNEKPVTINADSQTNALMVAAHPDLMPEIQAIVEELNMTNRMDSEGREIRIFPLKVARAEELAETIDEMFPEPPDPVDRRGRPMPNLREPREVVVRADPQTNSIIVDAPIQRMAGFEQLVEQLDRAKLTEETEIRTYPVVYADLSALTATLNQLVRDGTLNPTGQDRRVPISITAEPVSRTLIVSGPVEVFERVDRVLADLDVKRAGPTTTLRFFRLESARAESLVPMLQQILLTRIEEDIPEAGVDLNALLNVTADRKTNTLIISAPETVMPVVEQLVQQLDDGTASIGDPTIRVLPLKFADAADISRALSSALPNMISPATGEPVDVRLVPAAGSNAIILVGLEEDLAEVQQLIEPLDARPPMDAIDARTFKLAYADASRIATMVQDLLTDQIDSDPRIVYERMRRSRGQIDLTPKIRVEADQRTNSLIVSGPQQTVALAETLINQLDQPEGDAQHVYDTYTPVNAQAATLAATVQRVMEATRPEGRRTALQLIAEPESGAIVILGDDAEVDEAMLLLAQRDAQTLTTPRVDLAIVPLKHSDASVVARTISPLLADRTRWPSTLRSIVSAGITVAQPAVMADASTNRVLITAPGELMPLARQLVGEFDQPVEDGAVDVRVFTLQQAQASSVAQAVSSAMTARAAREPGVPAPTVQAEPSSNTVIVTAAPRFVDEIEALIAQLDSGYAADQAQVRTVFLQFARAETVAPIVEELLAGEDIPIMFRLDAVRRGRPLPDAGPDVRVAADSRLNAVIVSAPPAVLNIAEQMVAQLDVDPALTMERTRSVRVLYVENADATELAANLEALFTDEDTDDLPPTVRVDRASNSLLVRATDTQFQTIEQVVDDIDEATITASRQMRLVPVDPSRASAAEVARALQRMLDRAGSSSVEVISLEELLRRQEEITEEEPAVDSTSQTSMHVPARWNAVALTALAANPGTREHPTTEYPTSELIDEYKPAPPAPRVEAPVSAVLPTAEPVLSVEPLPDVEALRESLASGGDITIAIDPATNSLIVIGSPRATDRVAALAQQIQQQIPPEPGTIRYIALPDELDAASLARLITQTIAQLIPAGGQRGDLRNRVSVIADPLGNALVVTSNDTDFNTVGDLIAALSRGPATEQIVVKVFPLTTTTAQRIADSLAGLVAADAGRRGRGRQAQRIRKMALQLVTDGRSIEAVLDPEKIRYAPDVETNTILVSAPADAMRFIDRFVALLDQMPPEQRPTIKFYPVRYAQADELVRTLRNLYTARQRTRGRRGPATPTRAPEIAVDSRTNTLIITASPRELDEIDGLVARLDTELGEEIYPLRVVELKAAEPQRAAQLLEQVVIGSDQQRKLRTLIVPDNNAGVLLVRASDDVHTEIDAVLKEIDRDASSGFEIRTITLQRADAITVAQSVQAFFDDLARIASTGRGRRQQGRRVSIIGDPSGKTVLVAASDDDFEQVKQLVEQFDSPEATEVWSFKVYELKHAKAADIAQTANELISTLTWDQGPFMWWGGGRGGRGGAERDRGTVAVRADTRLNALIATGQGDKFDLVEQIIEVLDAPESNTSQRIVRLYQVQNADLNVVSDVVEELFTDAGSRRRWWEPPDPNQVRVRDDARSNTLIISASVQEHEEIGQLIASIDEQVTPSDQQVSVLAIEYAQAGDISRTLSQFLSRRAQMTGDPQSTATILPSNSANSLVVSAGENDLAMIRELLAQLDQPDVSGDRVIEIVAVEDGDAEEIGRIIREQFSSRGGQGVVVTADRRTNSLIINAPKQQFAQAVALIDQLDTPDHTDETIIRTYALQGAQADEAVRILTETLQLDSRGETSGITIKLDEDTPGVEVVAKVVADRRSNSLIVTATAESFPVIESLVSQLDEVPASSPTEYRIVSLQHAVAEDVAFTLERVGTWRRDDGPEPSIDYNRVENQLIIGATADQFEQLEKIIEQIDQPSERARITDFVPLQYAEAEKIQEALSVFYGAYAIEADTPGKRNVRIVADPATNSLVITADEAEWEDIRALLTELDSEEYDSSLQLQVIPLIYADSRSVARAINEAFQGLIERDQNVRDTRDRNRGREEDRREVYTPTVLVEAQEWVRASAEPQTNSVIVSASRQNIRKIEQIVEQIDVADFAKLPAPRVIPVSTGDPEQLADALNELYEQDGDRGGRTGLRIVGDPASNTVIVRADDEEFEQIRALAQALQQETASAGLSVHVIQLASAPAARVAEAIRGVYEEKAEQANQPLAVEVDVAGNSLIIASTGPLFEEIAETVAYLDRLSPAAGQGIFIIELEHISPENAKSVIESIGLHEEPRDDSISRIVTEPIKVSVFEGRNALIIVANPIDKDTIVGILKTIDHEPILAEAQVRIVRLRNAEASAVASIITDVFSPADQQVDTPLAQAVQEQIRRLAVRRDGLDEPDLLVDLTKPVRVIADENLNALVISSTESNLNAVIELVTLFDELPLTDAVTMQVFPLQNISAAEFARIVRDLFDQGKDLGGVPGSGVEGVPAGMLGKALLDEIAITVDERTNTVVVAGKDDAVALVEVLTMRLDSDIAVGWVEPRILPLQFADAIDLADTLNEILVEGAQNLPQSTPMQRQIGRLRVARLDEHGGHVLESDVFQPMTRLVIRPEPQLNALILVGTPINLDTVSELVAMLDTEAASPDSTVRIYPVDNASAARLAAIITRLFDQQVQAKAIRPEDRVIAQADERTNALIVTTSPRSFAVMEGLLETLDSEMAPDLREIRRIALERASASRLANMIQQLMDARLERLRRIQPETANLQRATIIADPRTNSLVVAAGNESFDVIKLLAEDLDESMLDTDALIEVIPLELTNVDRIADAIDSIMDRRYAELPGEIRSSQKPLVLTDPRSNSLLVAANPEDLQSIRDLVARLEATPANPAIGLHIVALPRSVSAEAFAPRLQRLMRERRQSLGPAAQPSDSVSIEPDPLGNTLIIASNEENLEIVSGLIDVLITAGEEALADRSFEVISLRSSQAGEIVAMLEELYVRQANRDRGDGTVQVTADERINAVLVNAAPMDVEAIRDLVEQLDGTKPASIVEIKYIALESANALETVSLIENVLSGRGIGSRRGPRQATVLKYLRALAGDQIDDGTSPTEMEVSATIRESISLTPDLRTNTIIVSAPTQSMGVIEKMIRDLDASSTGAKSVRIFKLVNADATAMAELLTDLFNLRQGNNLFVLKPREASEENLSGGFGDAAAPSTGAPVGLSGTELTAVPDERQQLSITVDNRTNSLIVSGTPTYLDLVATVVDELDAEEANEREVFVYQLRNAVADEVATVIGDFVEQEQTKLIETLAGDESRIGSLARLLEREITISGDQKSNTVLVSASPRYIDTVKDMIEQLDVDPPQVLIQVMLAEVTLDSEDDWGVDFAASGQIDSTTVSGGFGLASAFVTGVGVPNLAIASADFNLLINAMESQGRLQVLSNPSIMAANNEQARIQVGETIRVPERTNVSDTGSTNTSLIEQELGIILQVTPSVNPDGFVRLDVEPTISSLSQRTTQISEDLESPIITIRTARTVVTVHDGQTIVIGGLISDRFERRDKKVPFFGDLPLFGPLFRAETEETAKTELLIVLTPHVIESPTDFGRVNELTTKEVDRLTLPQTIRDLIREGKFDPNSGLYDADGKPIPLGDEDSDDLPRREEDPELATSEAE